MTIIYFPAVNKRLKALVDRLTVCGKLVPLFLRTDLSEFVSTPRPWNPGTPIEPEPPTV